MTTEFSDEELEKYREIARDARRTVHSLCEETVGWTRAAGDEDAVLEWREAGEEAGDRGWKCWRLTCVLESDVDTVVEAEFNILLG